MSDKITLKNMVFYGFHGLYEYERELGQRFYVDVEMKTSLLKAGQTDHIRDTVDYVSVYHKVKDIVENNRFILLEALAGKIAADILAMTTLLNEVTVKVRKPSAPIPGVLDYAEVEITRGK